MGLKPNSALNTKETGDGIRDRATEARFPEAGAPLFTAITLITLAVGIGANSAIFSVVRGILLKPLSLIVTPDQLVGVWENAPGLGWKEVNASPSTYFTFREENHTFEDVGLWRGDSVTVTGLAEPEQVDGLDVTGWHAYDSRRATDSGTAFYSQR